MKEYQLQGERLSVWSHQMFGLRIFPMNRMLSEGSVMRTMKGRLNLSSGVWEAAFITKPVPVTAVAVAPASSTSSVAWCTTYIQINNQ